MANYQPKLQGAAHLINENAQEKIPKLELLNQNATGVCDPMFIEVSVYSLRRLLDPPAKKA